MKALLCTHVGPPDLLELRDVPSPTAGPGEAVVSVKAASVNYPDVLIIQDKYQFKPARPFSPGSEFAGVVTEVGPGVTRVRPGDRVMAFTICGAFAEEIALPAERLLPVPAHMDFETAAAMLVTYGTMDHALRDRGALRAGESVVVLGAAGGIGIAAIEMAKALGAHVIACASSDDKLAVCRAHGADAVIDYARENFRERVRELTGGRGADVVVDPIGGALSEPAVRAMAWRGRFLVVGFAAGEIPKIPLNLVLLKGCAIVGVFWGDFLRREPEAFAASVERIGRLHAEGKLRPQISLRLPLARAAEGIKIMAERRAVGKIVILP